MTAYLALFLCGIVVFWVFFVRPRLRIRRLLGPVREAFPGRVRFNSKPPSETRQVLAEFQNLLNQRFRFHIKNQIQVADQKSGASLSYLEIRRRNRDDFSGEYYSALLIEPLNWPQFFVLPKDAEIGWGAVEAGVAPNFRTDRHDLHLEIGETLHVDLARRIIDRLESQGVNVSVESTGRAVLILPHKTRKTILDVFNPLDDFWELVTLGLLPIGVARESVWNHQDVIDWLLFADQIRQIESQVSPTPTIGDKFSSILSHAQQDSVITAKETEKKLHYTLHDIFSVFAGLILYVMGVGSGFAIMSWPDWLLGSWLPSLANFIGYIGAFVAGCVGYLFGIFSAESLAVPFSKLMHRSGRQWKRPLEKSDLQSNLDLEGCLFLIFVGGVGSVLIFHFTPADWRLIPVSLGVPSLVIAFTLLGIKSKYST